MMNTLDHVNQGNEAVFCEKYDFSLDFYPPPLRKFTYGPDLTVIII